MDYKSTMLDKEAGRDNRRRVIENTPCHAKRHYCHPRAWPRDLIYGKTRLSNQVR